MRHASIYGYCDYPAFLADHLRGAGRRGLLSRAASFIGCQRSYVSRVVKGEQQLTPDTAFRMASFLELAGDEKEFFLALVERSRTGDANYRAFLDDKIARMKRRHDSLQARAGRDSVGNAPTPAEYFFSWTTAAIHFLTAVPGFQSAARIAERLTLKPKTALDALADLDSRGFVRRSGDRWVYATGEFHLPLGSPALLLHHQNWRNRALASAQENSLEAIHFTAVQTISRSDLERLREMLREFIASASAVAGCSQPEEAFALTCDLFTV